MPRKAKGNGSKSSSKKRELRREPAPSSREEKRAAALEDRVIERPDGFYWESEKGESHGPFATLAEVEADMLSAGSDEEVEAEGGLLEAESELGINEWIDPDTGGPAEDSVPRIEDH